MGDHDDLKLDLQRAAVEVEKAKSVLLEAQRRFDLLFEAAIKRGAGPGRAEAISTSQEVVIRTDLSRGSIRKRILDLLARTGRPMTSRETASHLGVSENTTRGTFRALEKKGVVERVKRGLFALRVGPAEGDNKEGGT